MEKSEKTRRSTDIYREVFGCYPDDTMRTLKEIEEVEKKASLKKYFELHGMISGFVVDWPLHYL